MAESKSASVVFTNGSLLAKNAQASAYNAMSAADNAYNLAYSAQKTADGKNSIYRGSDPSTVPTANLKVGDLYFSENAAYVWNGSSWEETVSDTTGKEIHAKVEEAMAESKKSVEDLKSEVESKVNDLDDEIKKTQGQTGFFIGTTPPPNPVKGTVWATTDSSGNMTSAKTWNGSSWVSTAFTQDLVAGNITATKIQGGELDINKITVKNAQNIPITSTVSLGQKLSNIEQDADSFNAYIRRSKGSKTLAALLSMDPNNSTIAQVVNGQVVAAINTSSDGSVKIDGKTLHITADTKIENAVIKSAMIDSIEADKIKAGTLNADKVNIINLKADKITSGTLNGITITGSKFIALSKNSSMLDKNWNTYKVTVENTGVDISGNYTVGDTQTDVTTRLTGGELYIKSFEHDPEDASPNEWTKSIDINTNGPAPYIKLVNDGPGAGEYKSTYISSDTISSNDAHIGPIHMSYHHIRSDATIWLSNDSDSNFNSDGSVGLQIESGIGLGKNTLYTNTNDLYIQNGIVVNAVSYASASKTTIHCQKVISQVANTVSSRLSVKTDITPVTYDRALAAVEGTDMYDYRYVNDDANQHYVSGIIDDVNSDPQYHMDDMLINKERTARIDANLVGYHHVVIQKLLERVAALEEKAK